jgi:hypothetical protein
MKLFKRCGNSNSCVFVGINPHGSIVVADEGEIQNDTMYVAFSPEEWEEFLTGVKAGFFDLDQIRQRAGLASVPEVEADAARTAPQPKTLGDVVLNEIPKAGPHVSGVTALEIARRSGRSLAVVLDVLNTLVGRGEVDAAGVVEPTYTKTASASF